MLNSPELQEVSTITDEMIAQWAGVVREATPGPYLGSGYTEIRTFSVDVESPLNEWKTEEVPSEEFDYRDETPYAIMCIVPQAPQHRGYGDSLHHPQSQSNARYVELALNQFPRLLQEVERMRAVVSNAE